MTRSPRGVHLATLLVRSSAVLALAPGISALLVANTVLRGHPWDHEWGWALYQAGFVTVFLGPLCAGIGVWDGAQVARATPMIESAGRPVAARAAAWAAITGVVAAIYLTLLGALGIVLKAGGMLDWPGLVDLSPIPGVLALCGAWAAIGIAIGYRWPTPLLAPVTAASAFGLTLVLYLAQPFLVQVGGATASILFLEPRRSIQAAQMTLFTAVTAGALVGLPVRRAVRPPLLVRARRVVAPAIAVLTIGFLVTVSGLQFTDRRRPLVCEGARPRICVTRAYRDRIGWPRPYLEPYLAALEDMGIEAPTTFRQGWDRPRGQGLVPQELLDGHPPAAGPLGSLGPGGVAVLGAFLPDFCDTSADPAIQHAYETANWWLTSLTEPGASDDPTVPAVLTSGDHVARSAYLRAAFATLRTCTT